MILLDGDIIAYSVAAAIESGQGDYLDLLETLITKTNRWASLPDRPDDDVVVCLSGGENFRKAVYPEYKGNRDGDVEPPWRRDAEAFLRQEFYTMEMPGYEGDDVMGVMATQFAEDAHLVTIDKDLLQIPGLHYNPNKPGEPRHIDGQQGIYNFHMQWITGDSTDNYKGIPKMGPVKASKFLDKWFNVESGEYHWEAAEEDIVKLYREKGLTDTYCLQMAQCARILQSSNFAKDGTYCPFIPSSLILGVA